MAAVFFLLFSLLDYVCCREQFVYFFCLRLSYAGVMLIFLLLLRLPMVQKRYVKVLMFGALLLGTLDISLMTVQLGGFTSDYYVGILLMIVGAFSILPLGLHSALGFGLAMLAVYLVTVLAGTGGFRDTSLGDLINNCFFFLSTLGIATIQCFDDLRMQVKSFAAKRQLEDIYSEVTLYTEDLESLVDQRIEQLEEAVLRFRYLYDSLLDMVLLVDPSGNIAMTNRYGEEYAGLPAKELVGMNVVSLLKIDQADQPAVQGFNIVERLCRDDDITGLQARLYRGRSENNPLWVEINANRVTFGDQQYFQLTIRDISQQKVIERKVLESKKLIDNSRQAAIFGLARLVECRDNETGAHLLRIRDYTRILAEELAKNPRYAATITEKFIENISSSSILHDIGKIGVGDHVLQKSGKLTPEEFRLMQYHCEYGSQVLGSVKDPDGGQGFLSMAKNIARSHHEWWDGSGYPDGIVGEAIPLVARIVALADVYDALTSKRIYKPAFSHEKATAMIKADSGTHFDPSVVRAFLKVQGLFRAICNTPEKESSS